MTLRQPATKARGGQPGVRYITDDLIKKVTGQEHLAGVTSLNLNLSKDSNKRFKFIENLDRLKKLQTLNISYNGIEKMEKLERLSTLRELNLAYNSITKIEGIECITRLQVLNLTGNNIDHLPSWIGKRLRALRVFKIAKNLLQSLDEFAKLRPLKDLSQLTVADNPVASLPHCRPYLLFQLTTLEVIDGQPISEQEREAAHNRFAQEEVTGLLDQLEKKESEMERIQQVHNTSLQEGISREQKQLQQLDKYKQQQEAMKELRHELDTKSQLLKQKTSELMTASNKHYELEQELAFYKIDHKFGALSAPPRLPTPDSGAEAHDNDGLFGESPYIGKGRFQKLQRPGEKRFRGQVGQGADSTDLGSTGGDTLSVDSEAREKMRQTLDKDLEDKRQAIASAQDQLGQLHDDLAQTELQLQQANDELQKVATATPGNHLTEDDKQQIRSTVFDKIDKIHMLRDEASQVEEEMGRAQTEIQQRQGEIGMLRGRMLHMGSKDQLYKVMEQEVAGMEDQLALGQQQYRALQDQTSHVLQTIAHETHNIKSLEGELREGQAAHNDELKGELENIISGLQAYLSEARSSAEQQRVECEGLHREKGELMQRLQQMEEENGVIDEQAVEISSLREKLVDLEESLLENQERNESLTLQLEDSHIQEANEADLSARLNEAEEEVERMKEQVVQAHEQAKKEIEDYQKKLDLENRKLRYLKDKARDADTKEDEIRNLHRELSELQASNVHLQDQLFGMNQRLLEEKKKSINPEDLRRRLEAVTRAIKTGEPLEGDEREGSVGRALGDIHDRVKREMDKSRSDAEQAAGAMEKAEEEVKTLKDQVVQVQLKEREMAEMAIQSMVTEEKKEADRLRNELNRLSQELERTRDTARQAMRERDQERLRAIEKERELEKVVPVRLLEASPRAASSAASSSPTATTSETESVTTEITAPTTESTSTIPSAEWPVKKQELYESMNQDEQELFDELQQEIEQLRELLFRRDHKEAADMAVQAEQTAKQLRTMLDSHSSTSSGVESSTGSTIRHTTVKSLAKTGQRSPRATLELTRAEEEIARLKRELRLGHNPRSTGHQRASTIVSQEAEIDDLRDLVDVQQGQIDALHRELGGHRERRGHNEGRVGRSTHGPLVESQPHEDEIYAAEYTQTQSGRDDLPATRGRPVPTFYPSTDRPQAYQKAGGQREEHRPSPTTYHHSPTRQHSPSRRHAIRPPAEQLYYSPQSQHPMHQGRPKYYPEAPGGIQGTAGFGDGPDLAGASGVVDRMPAQTGPSNPTAVHLHPSVPAANLPGSYGVNPAQHGDVNRPGSFGANPNQPGAVGANPNQPGAFGANPNQSGAFGANPNQPGAVGANPNQPGAVGANPNQSGAFGANPNQPGAFGANPNQPGVFAAYPNQPGVFVANPNQPGAFVANPNQPGAFGVHQPPLLENAVHQLPTTPVLMSQNAVHQLPTTPVRSHPILIEGDQATTPIAGSLNLGQVGNLGQVISGPTIPGTLPSQPVMMSTPTTKGAPLRGILKRADGQVLPGDSMLLGDSSLLANEDMICTVPEHHDLEDYVAKLQAKVKRLQSKLGKVEWDTVDNSRRRVGFEGSPENSRVQTIQLELQERRQDLEGLDLAVERQKENLRKMREKEKSLLARQNSNLRQLEALGVIKPSHSRRAYLSGEASYNLDEDDYEMEYTPRGQRPHKLSYLQEEIACLEETLAKRRAELRHADQLLQDCQDDLISARKQAKLSLDEHVVARRVQKQTLLDVDELEKRAHQVGVEVIRTEEQLEDLRTEVDELQDLRNSQEEMLAQIEQVIRKKDTEFQEVDSETKTALQRLESIHEKLEELSGEEQERLRDNKHTLAHQQSQLTSISQQLTSGQGELERLTQDLGRGRTELQLLQDTIRKRQGQLENLDRDVEREIQAKRRELQEVDDKLLGLQSSRKHVDREITECKSQLEKIREDIEHEETVLQNLATLTSKQKTQLRQIEESVEIKSSEVEKLGSRNKSALGQLQETQSKMEEEGHTLMQLEADCRRRSNDLERLKQRQEHEQREVEALSGQRKSLEKTLGEMRREQREFEEAHNDLHSRLVDLQRSEGDVESKVRDLNQEAVRVRRELSRAEEALEDCKHERTSLNSDLLTMRANLLDGQGDLDDIHRSMKEAEGSVQQLKERETSGAENMRQGYLSLEDRIRNLGQELVKRDREAKKLTGALEKARSELHDTRSGFTKELQFLREKAANEIADLEGVAQTHYSRANRLSDELDDLRSEHANLVSKLENEEEKVEQERKFHETLLHLKDDMNNEVFERGRLTSDIIETTPQRDSIEQQLATLKENLHMIRSGADPLTVFVRKPDGAQFSFTEQQECLKKQLEQKMSRHAEAMHSKQQLSQNNIFSLQKKLSSLERVLSTSCSDLTSDKRHTAHIPTRDAAHTANKQPSYHKEVIPLTKFSPANSSQLSKVSDFPEKCVPMESEDTESKENDSGSGTRDLHTDDVAITTERPVSPASVPRRAYSPHRHSTQRSARLINQT